jgi:hypothetical protein
MIQIEVIVLYDYTVLTLVLRSLVILKIEPISVFQIRIFKAIFFTLVTDISENKKEFFDEAILKYLLA